MPYIHTHDNTRVFFVDTRVGRPIVFVASDRVAGIALVSGNHPVSDEDGRQPRRH